MNAAAQYKALEPPEVERFRKEGGLFSSDSVLNILNWTLDGSELSRVLTNVARLVESRGSGILCAIWLPDGGGKDLFCAVSPGLPGFAEHVGSTSICPDGASCGTAVFLGKPVYVADILRASTWDSYRDRVLAYGIRAVWSRPLFTQEGKVLGALDILWREVRTPDNLDLQFIEYAGHIAESAIGRHIHMEALRLERDRQQLLLHITNSTTSKLDVRGLIGRLSTNLLGVIGCDCCALLLPDEANRELRVAILYNPEARDSRSDGMIVPMDDSICAKIFRTGRVQQLRPSMRHQTGWKASATVRIKASASMLSRKA
jgi:formate hydrogenlyase transcriptional activator